LQIISLGKVATSKDSTHRHNRHIVHGRASFSAFDAHNKRLLKALFEFVGHGKKLHSFLIDSIDVGQELFFVLGRSLERATALRWFSIKNTPVEDKGFRLLTHALSNLTVQVLILENCGLTDDACKYLSTIIKVSKPHYFRYHGR
jgi:hypothetical protein